MTRRTKKPKPIRMGPITAYAIRPPTEGDPRWYWRGRVIEAGKERTVWTGRATTQEATRALAQVLTEGGHRPKGSASISASTVGLLLRWWVGQVERRSDLSPASVSTYRRHATRVKRHMDAVRARRLSTADLERYRNDRLRAGDAPATVAMDLKVLVMAWKAARRLGLVVDRDLVAPAVKVTPVRSRYTPTPGEIARVVRAVPQVWLQEAITVQWATGTRVGELAGMRAQDVDIEGRQVWVDGKTGGRWVPVAGDALAILVRRARAAGSADERLWGHRTYSRVKSAVNEALEAGCAQAGVPHFSSHGLRRAAVEALYEGGVDPGTAAAIMGHSPEVALRKYRQSRAAQRREAITRASLGTLPAGKVIKGHFGGEE